MCASCAMWSSAVCWPCARVMCRNWPICLICQRAARPGRPAYCLPASAAACPAVAATPNPGNTRQAGLRKKPGQLSEQDILQAMQEHDWEIQGAAQSLGISRPSLYRLLESHSQIRRPGEIPQEEIKAALAAAHSDMVACAAILKTPVEALRRYLRMQHWH